MDDIYHGYVDVMGRLLSPCEERAGMAYGYHEARWVDAEARLTMESLGCPERVAWDGEDTVLLLFLRPADTERPQNVAVLYMDGQREQAMSFVCVDGSGLVAAEQLFEQLLDGLEVQECAIAASWHST